MAPPAPSLEPDIFGAVAPNGADAFVAAPPPFSAPPPATAHAAPVYEPTPAPVPAPTYGQGAAVVDPLTPPMGAAVPPAASDLRGVPDHLVGDATPNTMYLGHRLRYEFPPEPLFNPLSNKSWMLQATLHFFIFMTVWFFVGLALFIVVSILTAAAKTGVFMVLYFVGAVVSWFGVAGFWFFKPFPALLSEWKFSVDRKGAAAAMAFEQIAYSFQQRQTPVDKIGIRRITQNGETNDYLEVKSGIFYGYVSCFPYGQDLFIAWKFWLNLSPAKWCLLWLKSLYLMVTMRGTELYVSLRFDRARAMREALHSACREGIDVAAGQIQPQGAGTVGGSIAVDLTTLAAID